MKSKSGVSAIVATVLILLITVAAVSLLFGLVLPGLRDDLDTTSTKAEISIIKESGYTVYDLHKDLVSVQVKRGNDNVNLIGLQFVLDLDDGNSIEMIQRTNLPNKGQTVVYYFNLSKYSFTPIKVSVASVVKVGDKEVIGDILVSANLESKKIIVKPANSSIILFEDETKRRGSSCTPTCGVDSCGLSDGCGGYCLGNDNYCSSGFCLGEDGDAFCSECTTHDDCSEGYCVSPSLDNSSCVDLVLGNSQEIYSQVSDVTYKDEDRNTLYFISSGDLMSVDLMTMSLDLIYDSFQSFDTLFNLGDTSYFTLGNELYIFDMDTLKPISLSYNINDLVVDRNGNGYVGLEDEKVYLLDFSTSQVTEIPGSEGFVKFSSSWPDMPPYKRIWASGSENYVYNLENYDLVADGSKLKIYEPGQSTSLLSELQFNQEVTSVYGTDKIAYIGLNSTEDNLKVIYIADKNNPYVVDDLTLENCDVPNLMLGNNNNLAVLCDNGKLVSLEFHFQ